jgi:hypothetical protein
MTPTAGVHTSVVASGKFFLSSMFEYCAGIRLPFFDKCLLVDNVGLPARSRKRKLTSDIWDDFTAIYDDDGALVQGQCIHCDAIYPA